MPESITCPICGKTSHNPNDVREGYCGSCHNWIGDIDTSYDLTDVEKDLILTAADERASIYAHVPYISDLPEGSDEAADAERRLEEADFLLASAIERVIAARFVPRTSVAATEMTEDG